MFKRVKFYRALLVAFIRRDKKKVTYVFTGVLLLIFFAKILIPAGVPLIARAYTESRKPTFTEGAVGTPQSPNPLFDTTETQRDISELVFRGLTKVNSNGGLVPDLAENFEKISDTEYIFNLRRNILWHDGQKFTSDDVVYTVKTAQNPKFESPVAANFKDVKVERLGSYSVKFTLNEPFAPFPFATTIGVVPKHVSLKKYKPIGTGPFKVREIANNRIVLSSPNLNIAFKFYMNFEEAKTALRLGEIHALGGFSPQEIEQVKNFGSEKIYQSLLPFRQVVVFFNTRFEDLKQKDVRQALSYAIDKDSIRRTVGGSGSATSINQLPHHTWIQTLGRQRYPFDLKKAREKLKEAGYKLENGSVQKKGSELSLVITTSHDLELSSTANLLKEQWVKLGIDVKTSLVEVETLRNGLIQNRDFQILVDFQDIPPDPDQYVLWHTTQTREANITGISSAKLDKLLEDGRKTNDQKDRESRYKLFTTLLLDESPAIFLYYPQYIWAVSKKVSGIDLADFARPVDRFNSYKNWSIESNLF